MPCHVLMGVQKTDLELAGLSFGFPLETHRKAARGITVQKGVPE